MIAQARHITRSITSLPRRHLNSRRTGPYGPGRLTWSFAGFRRKPSTYSTCNRCHFVTCSGTVNSVSRGGALRSTIEANYCPPFLPVNWLPSNRFGRESGTLRRRPSLTCTSCLALNMNRLPGQLRMRARQFRSEWGHPKRFRLRVA